MGRREHREVTFAIFPPGRSAPEDTEDGFDALRHSRGVVRPSGPVEPQLPAGRSRLGLLVERPEPGLFTPAWLEARVHNEPARNIQPGRWQCPDHVHELLHPDDAAVASEPRGPATLQCMRPVLEAARRGAAAQPEDGRHQEAEPRLWSQPAGWGRDK